MNSYTLPVLVACVLLVLILWGSSETWLGRVRRDRGEVTGGMKKDGKCPMQTDPVFESYIGVSPCPNDCRISLTDYDCLDAKKCCPTPCNGQSHTCVEPQQDPSTPATNTAAEEGTETTPVETTVDLTTDSIPTT